MRRLIAALSLALIGAPAIAEDDELAAAASVPLSESLRVTYNGYLAGFRIVKATVDASIDHAAYVTDASFRSAGIARMFKVAKISARTQGAVADGRLRPADYEHRNLASTTNRLVRIEFTPDAVNPVINPPFGSMGQPPATAEERFGSFDPITAVLSIMREGASEPCDRTVPVFDGKQRYDLRLEAVGEEEIDVAGYEGPSLRCDVYYVPISGFDLEDLAEPDVYDRPIKMWLAQIEDGLHVPVRFRTRQSGFRVSVEARRITHAVGAGG
ncbi:MAG: DUF3108 domain-containing protein [Caulobacterales bacterium]|nr:DUF3108 domain-containing protein [Caulobacterales bacterium]